MNLLLLLLTLLPLSLRAGEQATAIATLTSGFVTGITVTSGGSGYTQEPSVTITGGGGSGAAAKAILNGDKVASVIVLNAGVGYTSLPTVTIEARFYRAVSHSIPAGMVLIPSGPFEMGDARVASPVHTVTVSAYAMDKFEVTKGLWDEVRAWGSAHGYGDLTAGSSFGGASHPVHSVSWYDIVKWCNARSEKAGLVPAYYTDAALTQVYKTGELAPYVRGDVGYRLPTEAEWEKAARGGVAGKWYPWGTDSIATTDANFYDVSKNNNGTVAVGTFAPNGYGLYDMAGNVWEWVWDWWGGYSSAAQTNPRGPDSGSDRVIRGGSWYYGTEYLRCAFRGNITPSGRGNGFGFRCALGQP